MSWNTAIVALLTVTASARLTRLVTTDVITQPVRTWLGTDNTARPVRRFLHALTGCSWCTGVWVAAGAAAAHWFWADTRLYVYVVFALAAAYAVGVAHDWIESPPPVKVLTITPARVAVTHTHADGTPAGPPPRIRIE